MPCNKRIVEQAAFTYSPLGKPFRNKLKQKRIKEKSRVLKVLNSDTQQLSIKTETPEDQLRDQDNNEIEKIKKIEKPGE